MYAAMAMYAQRVDKPVASYEYFCFVQRTTNKAYLITDKPVLSHYIYDKDGNLVEFENDVEIINYMTRRGWMYVESIDAGRDNMIYVMKKNVTNDKNVFQGLFLKIGKDENKKAAGQ